MRGPWGRAAPGEAMSERYQCPVCGYDGLEEPHVDSSGEPSYAICPCCGTQFGADDVEKPYSVLRKEWIEGGMEWWSQREPAPAGWDGKAQLERATFPAPGSEGDHVHGDGSAQE
jgi:hypothetical protein